MFLWAMCHFDVALSNCSFVTRLYLLLSVSSSRHPPPLRIPISPAFLSNPFPLRYLLGPRKHLSHWPQPPHTPGGRGERQWVPHASRSQQRTTPIHHASLGDDVVWSWGWATTRWKVTPCSETGGSCGYWRCTAMGWGGSVSIIFCMKNFLNSVKLMMVSYQEKNVVWGAEFFKKSEIINSFNLRTVTLS